jgi:glycosyltransferase involved in cell wall biosynthesis
MIVNQWIPAAHRGDAIGDSARKVRDLLRQMGHESSIYAMTIDEDMRGEVRSFDEAAAHRGDVTIFHYALPSMMTTAFRELPGRRVLQYHNITPAHFFADYQPEVFRIAALGRADLGTLAGAADVALGDSDYNRRELEALGFPSTGVFPIALNLDRITKAPPHPALSEILDDGLTNFLFVGRMVPNKRLEDIFFLAELYKRNIDSQYRFVFVGRTDGIPNYYAALRALVVRLEMLPERFLFTGQVNDWELAAYYRSASVYMSLSEHEGFCVPVLEAMAAGVPVFARDSGAVGETLGGAGVTWSPKDLEFASELLGQLAFDEQLRSRVVARQYRRVEDFSEPRLIARLKELLGV